MPEEVEGLIRLVEGALETLRKRSPDNLEKWIRLLAELDNTALTAKPLPTVVNLLKDSGPNDRLLHAMTLALHAWDHEARPIWAKDTLPHSEERRRLILGILGFEAAEQQSINLAIPRYVESDLSIVIAKDHEPWYHDRKRDIKDFYWDHYKRQLSPPNGNWNSHAVSVLDASIDDVISRLSDPTRKELYQVKGLVMGYVQSGKTSHFSGLISKAADAGYRLVIVLAGTLDILRRQTQRRIDKEIIGKELLGPAEYGYDKDWESFVSHGGRPSSHSLGSFDWERLTNRDDDYNTLSRHLTLLEFKPRDPKKPFNHPDNLRGADAKIAVIKKVPARINKLCDNLTDLAKLRSALEHVPTLIIDDESDQASINVIDQKKPGKKGERTSTNKAIARLIKLLPRAQYVGYTATPFANVFIDPNDAEDLFPKDFIVSLPRPDGYMGVSDFFDLDSEFEDGNFESNKNAFVRPVEGDNDEPSNLPRALDSFVIAGAIKLFRSARDPRRYRFRHHTMLVHHSATQVVHESDRGKVDALFGGGARYQSSKGEEALRNLFESDFMPVSKVRAPNEPFPDSFDELRPYIAQCLTKICADKPVRIVNGNEIRRDETPDFEQNDVWAILVGGTKLSRGYTVEGLTISYYRRPTGAGDTLMQMGRWFGFRTGYRDLVRLFIGRKEPKGKVTVDLYEAFEAVCRDEEALRKDLGKYSKEALTPQKVPPLVQQHLPSLPVTSKNKRFNAEIQSQSFAGEWTEKTSAPTASKDVKANFDLASEFLKKCELSRKVCFDFLNRNGKKRHFFALVGNTDGTSVLGFLKKYLWSDGRRSVSLERNYIETEIEDGRLTQWQILLPQIELGITNRLELHGGLELSKILRSRVSQSRFGVYSDPSHVEAAAFMAGRGALTEPSQDLASRCNSSMPVMVLYFVDEKNDLRGKKAGQKAPPSVGFGIQYPGAKKSVPITWMVRDQSREDEVVI
jgi:hypothetical protein